MRFFLLVDGVIVAILLAIVLVAVHRLSRGLDQMRDTVRPPRKPWWRLWTG